ncbi:glucuronyl esterase domain-containing protein [Limnoglobus roseus]|uniref:4-O-methyl-glucuronoyl methylesterase n=1 Tax=Limnoglobus roseus TaxID=2598579 RepID=A0A5C1AMP0_9BACT|nr:acetylxylan esterase [Limnoglobus roseus]QEL20250.1 4-O-methyl-glucuronoyl methylesterase [Limnoglobus roseus]
MALVAAADFPPPGDLPARKSFPDPLTTFAGEKVTTKEVWLKERRPELKELFQRYMYGRLPESGKVTGVVKYEDKQAFGGKGTLREVELQIDAFGKTNALQIYLMIALPNAPVGAVPTFVGPNFGGNHLYTTDPNIRIPEAWMYDKYPGVKNNQATKEGRGLATDVWPLEVIIGRGYGVATFYNGDVQPDRPNVDEGFRKLMPKPKGDGPDDATATIMSWAWGVSRCADYLSTISEVDAKRLAVVGHSRLGKTALLAGAFDERFALVLPHQAGCGGTGPSRHDDPKAEGVKRINTAFPHWFSTSFKAFNDATEKLPFDQHCLAALCAPRPMLYTNATDDLWANPSGQFEMLKLATPVYELLGVTGLEATTMSPPNKLIESRLGYFIRPGKHAMTPDDWKAFMAFADKWLKK